MKFQVCSRIAAAVVAAVAIFSLAGCGGGLSTSSVNGKVVMEGGDLSALKGAHVELQLESDPTVRGSGEIKDDGSFEISTLYKGKVVSGAAEGTHAARIVLENFDLPDDTPSDDDDDRPAKPKFNPKAKAAPKPPIPEKYLSFKHSGWTIKVPTEGSVTLTIQNAAGKK